MTEAADAVQTMTGGEPEAPPLTSAEIDALAGVDTSAERLAAYKLFTPREKRDVMYVLHVRDGLTQKEIAQRLDVAQSTVSRQLTRAGVLRSDDAAGSASALDDLRDEGRAQTVRGDPPSPTVRVAMERVVESLHPLRRADRKSALALAAATLLPDRHDL